MKTYLKMMNALEKVQTNSLTEKLIKAKAMSTITDHLKENNFNFEYKVGKGFIELKK